MKKRDKHVEMSDEELFELVKKLDQEAFGSLYARYERRLFAYCLRVMGDRESAEDAFQSTVTACYEKRDSFIGGSFASWLFTIARNFCIKAAQRRSNNAQMLSPLEDYEDIVPDHSDRTGSDVYLQEALQSAILKLGEQYREALELRYYEDFSYEQIAERLEISLSLAKVRVFRAKQQLEKLLSPYLKELQL